MLLYHFVSIITVMSNVANSNSNSNLLILNPQLWIIIMYKTKLHKQNKAKQMVYKFSKM